MRAIGMAVACALWLSAAPSAAAGDLYATASFRAANATMPTVRVQAGAPSRMRDGTDRPDISRRPQTHAIYFVPADRRDERFDAAGGPIARAMAGVGAWFAAAMGRAPRLDVARGGALDVTFVRGDLGARAYAFDVVVDEIRTAGFDVASKRYVIFAVAARGETCGESQYPLAPGAVGRYIVVWLDSAVECGARSVGAGTARSAGTLETIVAHEWLHSEGVVPMPAPRHCATHAYHTCTGGLWLFPAMDPERRDVMFPFAGVPLREKVLDRDRDDYLDHGLPHVRDLRGSPFLG